MGKLPLTLAALLLATPVSAQSAEKGAALVAELRKNGCRMTEAQIEPLLGTVFSVEDIQAASGALVTAGLAYVEKTTASLILSESLCAAEPEGDAAIFAAAFAGAPDPSIARVDSFGRTGVRGEVALYLMDNGCVVDLSDREKAVADLTDIVITGGKFSPDMSQEARDKLTALVADFVTDPGKAYDIEADRMTLKYCTP